MRRRPGVQGHQTWTPDRRCTATRCTASGESGTGQRRMDAQYAGEFGPDALAIRHALQFSPEVVRRETASGRWNDDTVTTYLRRWAREAPNAIFATAPGYPALTFAEALDKSERFAAALAARGIRRGDVIMVQLPSSPDFLIAYLAAARL